MWRHVTTQLIIMISSILIINRAHYQWHMSTNKSLSKWLFLSHLYITISFHFNLCILIKTWLAHWDITVETSLMLSVTSVAATHSSIRDVTYPCLWSKPTRLILKFILATKTSNGLLMLCATIVRKCSEAGPKENAMVSLLVFQWFGENPQIM